MVRTFWIGRPWEMEWTVRFRSAKCLILHFLFIFFLSSEIFHFNSLTQINWQNSVIAPNRTEISIRTHNWTASPKSIVLQILRRLELAKDFVQFNIKNFFCIGSKFALNRTETRKISDEWYPSHEYTHRVKCAENFVPHYADIRNSPISKKKKMKKFHLIVDSFFSFLWSANRITNEKLSFFLSALSLFYSFSTLIPFVRLYFVTQMFILLVTISSQNLNCPLVKWLYYEYTLSNWNCWTHTHISYI